eukprot:1073904-Ditylum_brightwellii.AAC.1
MQVCVQISTFGSEFTVLKRAVEESVLLRYHLRALEVKVSKDTTIFVDNMSVVLNATNPGSTLKKKTVTLLYHFVHKHVANDMVKNYKITSEDNFTDPFTKAMVRNSFHEFYQ